MNPDKDYIESLLPRYCDGNVTDEERRMVVEWMNASEENKRIAKQINLIYLASHAIKVRRDIDTDKALNRVKGKMIVHRKRKYWEWAQRAAAVLFIPLLAATLLLSLRPEAESMPEVTASDNDHGVHLIYAQNFSDLIVQVFDIIPVSLLAKSSEIIQILTDLGCGYLHLAAELSGGDTFYSAIQDFTQIPVISGKPLNHCL